LINQVDLLRRGVFKGESVLVY